MMKPAPRVEDPSRVAPVEFPPSRRPKTYAYRLVGMPGAAPNTYMLCCHPIHGAVSFRPNACAAPPLDDNIEVSSTILVYSPCVDSPHRFLPWCQEERGPYPDHVDPAKLGAPASARQPVSAPTPTTAAAPPGRHISSHTQIQEFTSSCTQQYQWRQPADVQGVSMPAHTDIAGTSQPERFADPVAAPTTVAGQQWKMSQNLKQNISELNERMGRVLKYLDYTHKHYMNMVEVEKQRRDTVVGRISSLIEKLKTIQESQRRGPSIENADCLRPEVAARQGDNVIPDTQQKQHSPSQPSDSGAPLQREVPPAQEPTDLDCMEMESLNPWELSQRLEQWQQQLAQQMVGGQRHQTRQEAREVRAATPEDAGSHVHQLHMCSSFTHIQSSMRQDAARQRDK